VFLVGIGILEINTKHEIINHKQISNLKCQLFKQFGLEFGKL